MDIRTAAEGVAPDDDTLPFVDVDTASAVPTRSGWVFCVTAYDENEAVLGATIASLRHSWEERMKAAFEPMREAA